MCGILLGASTNPQYSDIILIILIILIYNYTNYILKNHIKQIQNLINLDANIKIHN